MKLSELISEIEETVENRFGGEIFWITAEITDVKKYYEKKWCFLKFIEKDGAQISTEIKGVFWSNTYLAIAKFEKLTGQSFTNGIEINCAVRVRFHKRFGLDLEVMDIDAAYSLGKLEVEKQQVLDRLLKENPEAIVLEDGEYITVNNQMELAPVFQRVALITAPDSDGRRDFIQELKNNRYGYAFIVHEYLTQIQGDQAAKMLLKQLQEIESRHADYDVVAIVRGGGSQTDFKPFDDYELAKCVALFPIPVLTGIGHDRNTSIVDMMARQHKTPTKVAAHIVDRNLNFESEIQFFKERFFNVTQNILDDAKRNISDIRESLDKGLETYFRDKNLQLTHLKRVIKSMSPQSILNKGFAIIMQGEKIITDPSEIKSNSAIKTLLKNEIIHSTVLQKEIYEQRDDL